jgi:SOS-response transcriptional repressor LexA
VKYYQPKGDRIELVAANPAYEPIQVAPGADFRLLGTVRGVIRTVGG